MAKHRWKPTTSTLAVWRCVWCKMLGFDPHPLPAEGCTKGCTKGGI